MSANDKNINQKVDDLLEAINVNLECMEAPCEINVTVKGGQPIVTVSLGGELKADVSFDPNLNCLHIAG